MIKFSELKLNLINPDARKWVNKGDKNKFEWKGKIAIQAFGSYRQKIPAHTDALEKLKGYCANQSITLVYDKSGIEKNDSLIAFMGDLAAARCIFLLLSPAYFQSAYTLFELVSIHKWADLDKRFILPIRVSEDMSAYEWTAAERFWREKEAIRDELTRQLGFSDHEEAWQQVKAAWDSIIFPFLDQYHPSLEKGDINGILLERATAALNAINTALVEEMDQLHNKVESEVERILESNFVSLDRLAREIELEASINAKGIARHLVKKSTVKDAIVVLTRVIQEKRDRLMPSKPEEWKEWKECHYDAEQLCGWLLINSIDPVWWFNHQLKIKQSTNKRADRKYSLTHPSYVEVIISRNVLNRARYKLDARGKAQPTNDERNVTLFDSISLNATDIQLLAQIYVDLHRSPELPSPEHPNELENLLHDIYIRAKSRCINNYKKPIYYLVNQTYMNLLQGRSWFKDESERLAEYLQFVYCDTESKNYDQSPCDDQESLLDQLAVLLSLRE